MKTIIVTAMLCLLAAGCASHNTGAGNRDYDRNCGYAMDELRMCGGIGPHEFSL